MKQIKFIILSLMIIGCDIFTTREPENPIQSRTTWIPPTTVDILVENLKSSLSEKSSENYLKCFVDSTLTGKSFSFIPATESYATYSSLFSNWNLQNERIYFENLKSKIKEGGTITLSIFNEDRGTIQGDSVNYSADYLLVAEHSVESIPKEFQGHLQFTLLRNLKGEWSILSWKDSKKTDFLTWSDLKGRFSY